MENFASDAEILAMSSASLPYLHAARMARVFNVTYQIAHSRLKTMQEHGLVERMRNGQYKIILNASSHPQRNALEPERLQW